MKVLYLASTGAGQEALEKSFHHPYLLVGWLWFLIMILPVSGLFQTGLHSIADRYTYLPSIGVAFMVVWGLNDLALKWLASRQGQGILMAVGLPTLLLCLSLTHTQLGFWQNTECLMQHALQVDPHNYVAHQDLAVYYSKLGHLEAASEQREWVRWLDPTTRRLDQNAADWAPPTGERRPK